MGKNKRNMSKFMALATTTAVIASSGTAMNVLAAPSEDVVSAASGSQSSVNQEKPAVTKATVSKLTAYGTSYAEAYDAAFRMPNSNVEKITNNGGSYYGTKLEYMLDGRADTHWETTKNNSSNFTNELVFQFKQAEELDRVAFLARSINQKGFPTEFEIYASESDTGEFQLVSTGEAVKTSQFVEFKFEPTNFKRLKFVFKKADIDRPFAAEVRFYKEDAVSDKVNEIFTDGTKSEVISEFANLDKINELEREAQSHVLYNELKDDLELAKKIVKGELNTEGTIVTAEQVGDRKGYASNVLRSDIGSNLQPTGLAVKAGDTITVYVEANGATKLPTMVFSQQEGSWASWSRSVQLSPGKNVIEVPKVSQSHYYNYGVTSGGMIYIINPYTAEQQGKAPVIRIEGAERVPYMTKDTDPAEFKAFLKEYKEKLDADKAANPNVQDREMIDVVEMVSDHVIYTGTATAAYNSYVTGNGNPKATLDGYDVWMHQIFDFHGLDGRSKTHDPSTIRESIRVMQPWGFMYAAGDHTGIQKPQEGLMFGDFRVNYPGWGLNHELGHRIDMGAREWLEVTNNMTSMGMSVKSGNIDNRIPYENTIYKYVIGENKVNWASQDLAARLGAFWQLELAHDGYWAELESLYRESKVGGGNDTQKQQAVIKASSDVLQKDLSSYFARHGFTVTDETKEYTGKYEESGKYWYLNNSVINYKGTGFTEGVNVGVNVTSNTSAKTHTLKFSINDEDKANLLGYEILRGDEVIGFTSSSSFTVKNVDTTTEAEYKVVAYDKKLGKSSEVGVSSFKPTISTEDNLTVKLRDENFDPLNHVKAIAADGTDITESVKVKSNTVNLTKKGNYEIVYEVTSQGVKTTKTMPVTVTSDFDYLSDLKVKSHNIAWGGLKLDKAPQGGTITLLRDGIATTYKKGIGAHANSQVVYDVEGKGYDYFESYIGIDQAMKGKNSSATFEVWVDGEKKYTSGVFGSGTNREHVKVSIKDAKQVKLVTTDAGRNGNEADHTVWADAKFTRDDSKPVITVTSEATKVGEPIDIKGKYLATDAEDGDLTSLVNVTGTEAVNFNKAGDYEIVYTVSDKDGNEVTATRTISVVDMRDFKHLSAYNWKSENHSYSAPVKNKATSGNPLRLTKENGEVIWYEKGIGSHSNSTIVYDLTDKNAAYFTSYVGVDYHMYNSVGSVVFQVYVDGEKKFDSGLMTSKMAQKYVEVSLAGAKELKLVVTDGGNGNGSDHATWADAKLHYANEDRVAISDPKKDVQATEEVNVEDSADASVEALQGTEADLTTANINKIKEAVKNALTNSEVDISDLNEVSVLKPAISGFSGTVTDKKVKELIENELGDSITGKYGVHLSNPGNVTIDELLENHLMISHQVNDDASYYTYAQGKITKE